MTDRKMLKRTAAFAIAWMVLIAFSLTSSTYAWFTYNSRVEIAGMTVNSKRFNNMTLEVSSTGEGDFRAEESLVLHQVNEQDQMNLMPVSTADLESFITCISNDPETQTSEYLVLEDESLYYHAVFYLRVNSDYYEDDTEVEVLLDGFPFSVTEENSGILKALRLGVRIDDMDGNIYRAYPYGGGYANSYLEGQLIPGNAVLYEQDGEIRLTEPECLVFSEEEGNAAHLLRTGLGEVHKIDLYIYLEGCDPYCTENISLSEFDFELNFMGTVGKKLEDVGGKG